MSSKCPVCNSSLQFAEPIEIKQRLVCSNCGLELEVVWLYPLELVKVSPWEANNGKTKKFQASLRKT